MTSVADAFDENTKWIRAHVAGALAMRHVHPRVEFLRVCRQSTLTVFEHLRRWWS